MSLPSKLLLVVSVVLIIVGLKFCSIGSGPARSIQNDGFNVTGGFMTMVGGIGIGIAFTRNKHGN